jgi:hypothetical protein
MENTLGIYIRFAGWQGGTLSQAINHFKYLPMTEKDRFINRAMHALDSHNLADVENLALFTRMRISVGS